MTTGRINQVTFVWEWEKRVPLCHRLLSVDRSRFYSLINQPKTITKQQGGGALDSRSSLTRVNANLKIASDRQIDSQSCIKTYKRFNNLLLAAFVCNEDRSNVNWINRLTRMQLTLWFLCASPQCFDHALDRIISINQSTNQSNTKGSNRMRTINHAITAQGRPKQP